MRIFVILAALSNLFAQPGSSMPTLISIFEYCNDGFGFADTESRTAVSAITTIKTTTSKITIHLAFFFFKVFHPLCPQHC